MVSTRSSQPSERSDDLPTQDSSAGEKRKEPPSPSQKKHNQGVSEKKQKTLEDTNIKVEADKTDQHDTAAKSDVDTQANMKAESDSLVNERSPAAATNDTATQKKDTVIQDKSQDAIVESSAREESTPSNILEKGLIYFFFRGRVGIENPSDTNDVARSYIVLRPIPHGAGLGNGAVDSDSSKYRVLALPKKVLPSSPRDRFMVFVEHASVNAETIKENVLQSSDYATKTAGTRHTPSATPVASGVYAIIKSGRDSHLAYMLTLPEGGINEVQRDIGFQEKGSFVVSVKNPQYEGPANTNLPQGPDFPQEIIDEFRSLRWCPLQARMLDYENTQMLLIGSNTDEENLSKIGQEQRKGHENDPVEELGQLEEEDEVRADKLDDHKIFEDLALSHKEYSGLQTSWN